MEGTIGEIRIFTGNYAPENWMFCTGQSLMVSSLPKLYKILGNKYGGDETYFCLPNLSGRAAIGSGTTAGLSSYTLGQMTGSASEQLNLTQMPAHYHEINNNLTAKINLLCSTLPATTADPTGAYPATATSTMPYSKDLDANMADVSINVTAASLSTSNAGGGLPHNNMQPYLAINYIICIAEAQ